MLETKPSTSSIPMTLRQRFLDRKIWVWLMGVVLVAALIAGIPQVSMAQIPKQDSFRLSRLESENRALQSRISQLESQVNRLSRAAGISAPAPAPVSPDGAPGEGTALANDPMFDRLATLVIETRQDVFALQERLDTLEARIGP